MSQAPTPDPCLERCVRHNGLYSRSPRESTSTPIEWLFTALHKRSQRFTTQETIEEEPEQAHEDNSIELLEPVTGPPRPSATPEQNPQTEMTNLELQTTLLTIARQSNIRPQKKLRVIKEPDPFSGGSPNELRVFIFQCQIYFRACDREFSDDAEKIFFAISYLRDIALDYFKPFINKPDPYHDLDFLED